MALQESLLSPASVSAFDSHSPARDVLTLRAKGLIPSREASETQMG